MRSRSMRAPLIGARVRATGGLPFAPLSARGTDGSAIGHRASGPAGNGGRARRPATPAGLRYVGSEPPVPGHPSPGAGAGIRCRDLHLPAIQVSLDRLEHEHREQVPPEVGHGCRGDHVLDQQDTPCRHAFIMRVHGYRARENAVCPASIRALRMPDELAHAIDLRPFLRADRSASRSVPGCGPGHRGGMPAPLLVAGAAC